MMRRIGGVLAVVGLVGASPAAAQRAVVAPRASLLFASAPSVVEADTSGIRPTYWKEGAILTGVPVGILGYLLVAWLLFVKRRPLLA